MVKMQRLMMSVSDEMYKTLEQIRKERQLETIQEVIRLILSEHISKNKNKQDVAKP